MVDRHLITRQRKPSIKSIIEKIEAAIETEVDPAGREQLEKYLDYWKRRRNHVRQGTL